MGVYYKNGSVTVHRLIHKAVKCSKGRAYYYVAKGKRVWLGDGEIYELWHPVPDHLKKKRTVKPVDPMVRALRKAYRGTAVEKVDKLLKEQTRWKGKQTLATNKLAKVRKDIDKLVAEMAKASVTNKSEPCTSKS